MYLFSNSILNFKINFNSRENDVLYTGLPLYHSSGQWFAMGAAMYGGFTAVLRKRFSASKFWQDCVKYDATIMHHIGECCRFLLGEQIHFQIHTDMGTPISNFDN